MKTLVLILGLTFVSCTSPETIRNALDSVETSLAKIEDSRAESGQPGQDPLGWKEWAIIGGGILTSIFGVNSARNSKYVKKAIS